MRVTKILPILAVALLTGCAIPQALIIDPMKKMMDSMPDYEEEKIKASFSEKLKIGTPRSEIDSIRSPSEVQPGTGNTMCAGYKFNKSNGMSLIFVGDKLESWVSYSWGCAEQLRLSGYSRADKNTKDITIRQR